MSDATKTNHVFEHLAAPPYKFTGHTQLKFQACPGEPTKPGGSCDYCGTAIVDAYSFVGSDGRRFKVGSDCVRRAGDAGLYSQIQKKVNQLKTARRHEREDAVIARAEPLLQKASIRAQLAAAPHPTAFLANQGQTRLDWIECVMAHGGRTGRFQAAGIILGLMQS